MKSLLLTSMKAALVSPLSNRFYKQLGSSKRLKGWSQEEKKERRTEIAFWNQAPSSGHARTDNLEPVQHDRGGFCWGGDEDGQSVRVRVRSVWEWSDSNKCFKSRSRRQSLHQWRRAFVTKTVRTTFLHFLVMIQHSYFIWCIRKRKRNVWCVVWEQMKNSLSLKNLHLLTRHHYIFVLQMFDLDIWKDFSFIIT